MRNIILIIGLIISVVYCSGQTNRIEGKTMLEEFSIKGKVKTVTYEYKRGTHTLQFDEDGKLVKQENNHLWAGVQEKCMTITSMKMAS